MQRRPSEAGGWWEGCPLVCHASTALAALGSSPLPPPWLGACVFPSDGERWSVFSGRGIASLGALLEVPWAVVSVMVFPESAGFVGRGGACSWFCAALGHFTEPSPHVQIGALTLGR